MQEISNEEREHICNEYELASKWLVQLLPMSWWARFMRWRFDRKFQRYMGALEVKRMKKERADRMYEVLKNSILTK